MFSSLGLHRHLCAAAAALCLFAAGTPLESWASEIGDLPRLADCAFRDVSEEPVVAEDALLAGDGSGDCDFDCCYCYCPRWTVSLGMVVMTRSSPDNGIIVAANPVGTDFSNGNDFDFGLDLGLDAAIARRLNECHTLEVRYLRIDSDASLQFATPGNFIGAGFTGPTGTNIQGRYESKFDNLEFNLHRDYSDRLTFLAGFRWVEQLEDLDYRINTTTARGRYEYNNRMYGGQIGANLALTNACRPLQINVLGKIGYYGVAADGGITTFQGNNLIQRFAGDSTFNTFIGEIGVNGSYQLTNHISLRGGYSLLWFDNVVLASNNAAFSLQNPSLLQTNVQTSDLLYHGATASLEFAW